MSGQPGAGVPPADCGNGSLQKKRDYGHSIAPSLIMHFMIAPREIIVNE